MTLNRPVARSRLNKQQRALTLAAEISTSRDVGTVVVVPDAVAIVASDGSASRRSGVRNAKLARQLMHSAVAKSTRAQRSTTARPGITKTKVGHQMESNSSSQTSHSLMPLQFPPVPPPLHPSPTTQGPP